MNLTRPPPRPPGPPPAGRAAPGADPRLLAPLDAGAGAPLYRLLKARILSLIGPDGLAPGSKLPSERELMQALGISRITVRQALTELVSSGHLRARAGKGFFVAPRPEPFEMHLLRSFTANALARGLAPGSRLIEAREFGAPEPIAAALGLAPGAPVVELHRLRTLDGVPVVLQSDWLDAALVPGLAGLDWSGGNRSLYAELAERWGLAPQQGRSTITARAASAPEAAALGLAPGDPVLLLEQIAHDAAGRAINLSRAVHHPTRYPLTVSEDRPG